ncbi:bifunctional phosphoribosyl-AMP cyclohydrolase/phosphoribosyl-ATP diphosphatase HisIE [Sphingomonas sp.]|uniref:bifunctional phosphoribosyl-AMP cyclohydrolase/phosphoribosyl-ATP diphosphatase HisIE n=1 Tax=Sphingomonas sp. TaxID=28214 RepID=UPI002FCB2C33
MRDRNAPLGEGDVAALDWAKMDGLLPAVVQDHRTLQLLMLGYMNEEALRQSLASGLVTFYSRSKGRLWTKGETSGNHLKLQRIFVDCDGDALLVMAEPVGPTCHLGTESCFTAEGASGVGWLARLATIVHDRAGADPESSYTARLLAKGPTRIAQKIGEEGVEVALAGATGDRDGCISETADLVYHLTVLMEARGFGWEDVAALLKERHK